MYERDWKNWTCRPLTVIFHLHIPMNVNIFYFLKKKFLTLNGMWKLKNWPVNFCICVIENTWWLVPSFLRISPWILTRLTSNKNWHKLKLNWEFCFRKRVEKNWTYHLSMAKTRLTISPWWKLTFGGSIQLIDLTLNSIPWKFQLHFYHSFRERHFSLLKKIKGLKPIKTHLSVNFFHFPTVYTDQEINEYLRYKKV